MPKTISVTEAKNKLSTMLQWAVDEGGEIIIESHGEPKAVILSYDEYEKFIRLREKTRRQEALRQLEELAARMRARNTDLTADEAEAIAEELAQETLERMVSEGKIKYQP